MRSLLTDNYVTVWDIFIQIGSIYAYSFGLLSIHVQSFVLVHVLILN